MYPLPVQTTRKVGFLDNAAGPSIARIQKLSMGVMVIRMLKSAMVNFMRALSANRNLSVKLKQLLATSNMRIVGSYGFGKDPFDIDIECWRLNYPAVIRDLIKIHLLVGLQVHCFCYGYDGFIYKVAPEYRILCAPKWTRILHKTIWAKDWTRKKGKEEK